MTRRTAVPALLAVLLLGGCGDRDGEVVLDAVPPPGAGVPQGPAPAAGLRGGDLPTGGTLTGSPASSLARVGDVVYAAGVRWVAPLRGSALALDPATGALDDALGTNGAVAAAVPDGRGGTYLAGDFDRTGRLRRGGIVHLFGTGEVDRRFRPRLAGPVSALVLDGGILYAGGSPEGRRGRGVLALNAGTGARLPGFDAADVGPGVTELALRDGTLYAGGSRPGLRVREVEGDRRPVVAEAPLAAVDARSGEREPGFAPAPAPRGGAVSALRVVDGRLWVGARTGLVLRDAASGAVTAESPVRGAVRELLRDGERVVAVGALRGAGGRDLARALDPGTGAPRSFRVRAAGRSATTGLLRGDALWLGGAGRAGEGFVATHDLGSGAARPDVTAPVPDGPVATIASAGGRVLTGGDFSAADVRRQDLAAFSATTGRYAAGVRLPPTRRAGALAAAGGNLWVADGRELLVVEPASGAVRRRLALPLDGPGTPRVRLAVAAGRVFVSTAGGGPEVRGGLVAYDGRTGAPVRGAPTATGPVALAGDGNALWIGGAEGLVRLDARTGRAAAGFGAEVDGTVTALLLTDDRLYVAGRFGRVGGLPRRDLAAVDPATGAPVRDFEPGGARGGTGARIDVVGETVLLGAPDGRSRAWALDGGPAGRGVRGAARVTASVPGAGGGHLVAGALRSPVARPSTARGVILPPRG